METTATKTVRVVIVDDEPLICTGVATVLDASPGFELVADAKTSDDYHKVIRAHRPDVVIMEYQLGGDAGAGMCRSVHEAFPRVRILVLTRHKAERVVMSAFEAGATGFLLKDSSDAGICEALGKVAKGEHFVDSGVSDQVVRKALRSQRPRNPFGLTRQEIRALELVARGVQTAQIAKGLGVTVETAQTHLKHALRKLGADDPGSAAEIARRNGLFDEGAGR